MKKIWNSFWGWYDSHPTLTLGITLGLFSLQIIHLIWLLTSVIWTKAFGHALFAPHESFEQILVLVDYTEIPALISASLVYIDDLRKKVSAKAIIYLIFLNTQWLHLFWITDEFVVSQFTQNILIPSWLAWIAILIDYLEVPIIYDTLKKFILSLHKGKVSEAFKAISERD